MADESSFALLDEWIAKFRSLPEVVPDAIPEIAKVVGTAVREDVAAGRDPGTGEPWALTKDGEQAMKGAAEALEVTHSGLTITVAVGAPYVFHHYGVRGALPRHVVPDRTGLKLGNAIRVGLVKPFKKHMGVP